MKRKEDGWGQRYRCACDGIRIIQALAAGGGTVNQIATRLDLNYKKVRRWLDALQVNGFAICSEECEVPGTPVNIKSKTQERFFIERSAVKSLLG